MKKTTALIMAVSFLCLTLEIKPLRADDAVSVGHGDQFVVTLRDDRACPLVDIDHTVLLTSNRTISGVFNMEVSVEGTLVGEPDFVVDSDIDNSELLWKVEDGITKFNVTIETVVKPLKFKGMRLSYTLNGSLKFQNGSWIYRAVFSSTAGYLAPPEIVVKVPKPSEFQDLSFEEIIPIPHVFLEEGLYYTLVWKSEVYMVGNTSATLVRLKYSATTNWLRIVYRFGPPVITFFAGIAVRPAWKWFKEKRKKPSETNTTAKATDI